MAKVLNNIVTQGLSGLLGNQIVFRKDKIGRTIVAVKPTFSEDRQFNISQLTHQDAFREAIAYARTAKDETVYIEKAEGTTKSSFNVAVADWFSQPVVLDIDKSNWAGQIGQTIRIKATDSVHVSRVHFQIKNQDGTIFEPGEMVRADGLWWMYTTTTQAPISQDTHLTATAYDLPGNKDMKLWSANYVG